MRSPEEFQKAALERGITFWKIHNCSMCDYPCGYVISSDAIDVGYDTGCDCTRRYRIEPREWEDLAEAYNMQKADAVIKRMNEFWGFSE